MSRGRDCGGSLEEVRAGVAERLRARRPEIEEAIFARICDTAFGPVGSEDPEYLAGLHTAVTAAVELSLMGIQQSEASTSHVPPVVLEQARRAARLGVNLDTVLRRYIAGQGLLADFIVEEASRSGFSGDEASLYQHLRETQTPLLERLTGSVIEAYTEEIERVARSPEQRRIEIVLGILAGGQPEADAAELGYDFDAWHIGVIATGARAAEFARGAKEALGCERLAVLHGERSIWLWFGRRRKPTTADVKRLSIQRPNGVSLAVGEPRRGIEGWRLTHQEAQAALVVGLRKPPGLTRCSDVLLEAAVLQQNALVTSLIETFLSPLDSLGYRGQTARDTLRAYFETRRNVSSTASRLGVARNTVESRLREIEETLGRLIPTCSAQLEVALRLEALDDGAGAKNRELASAGWSDLGVDSILRDSIEQSAQSATAAMSTLVSHGSTKG